jgi:peptidoglycan/LPS O-acetylase OafA/YrhL
LALTIGVVPPKAYVALGIFGAVGLMIWNPGTQFLTPFLGGIAASFLVRIRNFCNFAASRFASFIIIGCLVVVMLHYPTGYDIKPLLLLSIAFALIASGNSLFGILTNSASRTLGEFAYGIYLLHSIMLFAVFNFIIGIPASMKLSPWEHWTIVLGMVPILIIVCFLTFRFVERPAMRSTKKFTHWLRFIITKIKRKFVAART